MGEKFAPSTSTPGVYTNFVQSPSTSGESAMHVKKEGYDVFINHFEHRLGPAIYKELTAMGLNVFLNSEDCEDEEVEAALKSAWLYIPIFSGVYAQSSRRLEERSFMHGREDIKIVPIFCDVDTADVRYAKGVYAFDPSSENQECKRELYSVSHYIGPEVNCEEDEHMLPKAIAEWVAKEGKKFQEFASASTSSGGSTMPAKEFSYDVFINHRGPDVKRTLAKDIYEMLTDMGLKVFLDSNELGWGDHFPSVLEEVMKSAWLHIAIFSESYAHSKWCLRELSFMCSREGAKIVPIYYGVGPFDLRYAKGRYAEAFDQYVENGRQTPEKLLLWKEALRSASNYAGHIVERKEDEDMLLKKIADCVAKEGKELKEFALADTGSRIQRHLESRLSTFTSGRYASLARDIRYDVFINYRGPGVKLILATPIYKKLTGMGIKAFLDIEEIRLGEHIGSVIEEAIRSAKIHIAIFSPNYTESTWCLAELSRIIQTGTRVIPVFYHICPTDLRYYAVGAYADAFQRHERMGRYNSETLEEFKEALRHASLYLGPIVDSVEVEETVIMKIADGVAKEVGEFASVNTSSSIQP